ncbi:MAG TPA: hypothetical protein VIJ77_04275, partial [Candidatus Tumulicola sp.]
MKSISMWPANGSEQAIAATISHGAYYFDEANCQNCVLELRLTNGRAARLGISLRTDRNFGLVRNDLSGAAVQQGIAVSGSPFNAPENLVEGPNRSIWILDRLGNRVAAIGPDNRCHEYELPTPFADAGDIVGTSKYVWVVERNPGKIVRFSIDGATSEFAVGSGGYNRNLRITLGDDGRIWFITSQKLGAIDERGRVTTYSIPAPVFWLRDLVRGPDGRVWAVGSGSSQGDGAPFLIAVDGYGDSQRY